ncbi:MAG: 6-carboxytetrahydropterin synthase, partial [Nitrospiraceae bacterium]
LDVATVTRRYSFTSVQDGNQGREWDCFVSVHGPIDPVTGMVTDIGALNRLVQGKVVQALDRQDLRQALGTQVVTGEQLVEHIWKQLAFSFSAGRLSNVRLVQSRDLFFEFAG